MKNLIFNLKNHFFKFSPDAFRSYGLLPAGIPNEPETQIFLQSVLAFSGGGFCFVDVGASIGEFAITMADHARVARVYAFEPHPKTFKALSLSAERLKHKMQIIESAVGEINGKLDFLPVTNHPPEQVSEMLMRWKLSPCLFAESTIY